MFEAIAFAECEDGNGNGFQIDYDEEQKMFRVAYFNGYNFVDDALFDKEVFEVEE